MPKQTASYQQLSDELETILDELQTGETEVEAAAKLYERGLAIVRQLETMLTSAENKVTELSPPAAKDEKD